MIIMTFAKKKNSFEDEEIHNLVHPVKCVKLYVNFLKIKHILFFGKMPARDKDRFKKIILSDTLKSVNN